MFSEIFEKGLFAAVAVCPTNKRSAVCLARIIDSWHLVGDDIT